MELIFTEDGSHTLYLKDLNETYHSRHGAIQESVHVFIKNGLRYYISVSHKKEIHLFELGLGTGLNALLSAIEAEKFKCQINYEVIEPHPVPSAVSLQLNYVKRISQPGLELLFKKIHDTEWGVDLPLSDYFRIKKDQTFFENYPEIKNRFDVIYYDAFAPGKQPEIWERVLLEKTYQMLIPGGILVTYCAQGKFKRDLRNIGYQVETLIGPPGKKEMIRATK
jgi:tRNA U34 5-methylaminomethyl-2-thiouridine-forming methyltransferase MnmC